MSKRAQQNQSAFDVGNKIGLNLARNHGELEPSEFNKLFRTAYYGNIAFQGVAHKAARIGYENGRDKAAKAANTEELNGEQNA